MAGRGEDADVVELIGEYTAGLLEKYQRIKGTGKGVVFMGADDQSSPGALKPQVIIIKGVVLDLRVVLIVGVMVCD